MFGSTEQGKSSATSGNILADLKWGSAMDVSFGESKTMWILPLILLTIILLKRKK